MASYQGRASQSERKTLSIPQVYVQLQFGLSWSPRHTPQTHSLTYMSKSLRSSTEFPRQNGQAVNKPVPKAETTNTRSRNPNVSHHSKDASRSHQTQQPRKPDERRRHHAGESPRHHGKSDHRRYPRSDDRGGSNDRGNSAPPTTHNEPWNVDMGYMTSALAPHSSSRGGRHQSKTHKPQVGKPLPPAPSQFRLGSDGLPWSSWGFPEGYAVSDDDEEISEELAAFRNNPTTVSLSPERRPERRYSDDPARIQELENLSLAMVTVDNGFENQWWNQGTREWIAHSVEEAEAVHTPHSDPGESRLVSALDESPVTGRHWSGPSTSEWSGPAGKTAPSLRMVVSPISENSASPAESFRPIQRSLTTRSEELFIGM